jgi:transcriptional regulator with XRE-family HTH domain
VIKGKNIALGAWIRQARLALGKNQREIPVLSQQDWSRVERGVWIPSDALLRRVCEALGCDFNEVRSLIESTRNDYADDWLAFKNDLVERSLQNRKRPLQVIVIREDSEEFGVWAANRYYEFLKGSGSLRLTIFFRYSNPLVWRSFGSIAGNVVSRWHREDGDLKVLQEKFAGFYRHPDFEESRATAMPMASSVFLVLNSSPSAYTYQSDPRVYQDQKRVGADEATARQNSMVLLPSSRDLAAQIEGWIGAELLLGYKTEQWVPISLPQIPSG